MQKYLLNKSTWDDRANRQSPHKRSRHGSRRKSPEIGERGEVNRDASASLDSVGSGFLSGDEDEMMAFSFDTMEMSPTGNRCLDFPDIDAISDIDEDGGDVNESGDLMQGVDEIGKFELAAAD